MLTLRLRSAYRLNLIIHPSVKIRRLFCPPSLSAVFAPVQTETKSRAPPAARSKLLRTSSTLLPLVRLVCHAFSNSQSVTAKSLNCALIIWVNLTFYPLF